MPFTLRPVTIGLALPRVLGPRLVRTTAAAAAVVLALGTFAGLVRLLPWLVSPNLPLSVAWPFAKVLLATALEVALVVGLPLGWALSFAISVDRGEVRALEALGTSPMRLVGMTAVPALGIAGLGAAVVLAGGRDASRPGRLAADLLAEARVACAEAPPRAIDVPLVGASWLCFEGSPPILFGRLGEGEGAIPFTAAGVHIDDQLDELAFDDFRLVATGPGSLRLQVANATIRGVSEAARTAKVAALPRALLLFLTAAWLSLGAGFCVARAKIGGLVVAGAIGMAGPLTAVATLSALEGAGRAGLAYLLVPLASSVSILAVLAMRECVARRRAR